MIFLDLIKTSFKYAFANKIALAFIFILIIIWITTVDTFRNTGYGDIIYAFFSLIFIGYGMEVTRDVIKGGKKLPKIRPKFIFISAIKGIIVYGVYMAILSVVFWILNIFTYFPQLPLDQIFLSPMEIFKDFSGDMNYFAVFVIITFILTYSIMFFSKIAFASVAETGNILDGFNFKRIIYVISKIGVRDYIIGYTCILFLNTLLLFISDCTFDNMMIFSLAIDWLACELVFLL